MKIYKSKLNTHEKNILRDMGKDMLTLRLDWPRRLQNSLLCLVLSDPRWMMWVQREIDPESMSTQEITRLIEARARFIVLKPHSFFGNKILGNLIFREDWMFTDRGNLGPG